MFASKSLISLLSIAAACAAADRPPFKPGPASSYPSKLTAGKVTVAAQPFETEEMAKSAFGKVHPYEHGVLPVLVVIENGSGKALRLENMQVEYIAPDRSRIEATPADEVRFLWGRKPNVSASPFPSGGPRIKRSKNPLESPEIEGRAFSARMLPPGESAHGFFYFRTGHRPGSTLYITGIQEAATGTELIYFEIPLEVAGRATSRP